MARPDKAAAVKELAEQFSTSDAAVLTEYRGLKVKDLKALRRSLGETATYAVAKNTLTAIAAKEAGIEGLDEQLTGPTAIAFIKGDVATVAKNLRDFAKANPFLVIKGGVMDGRVLDADTVKKLANLESREVLLAKMAGAMTANLSKAVYLLAAPLSGAARDGCPAGDQERNRSSVTALNTPRSFGCIKRKDANHGEAHQRRAP